MKSNAKTSGMWDAASYFRNLTERNVLASELGFRFVEVSGVSGLVELLGQSGECPNIIAVDDTSDGALMLDSTPHRKMVKSVFISMRHDFGDMSARQKCFSVMHEIFRQFVSHLTRERQRLAEGSLYLDEKIAFNELDRYFATGSACAMFQLSVTRYVDTSFSQAEWK